MQRGISNIIAVDDLRDGDKFRNLADLQIADYVDHQRVLRSALPNATLARWKRCSMKARAATPWKPTVSS